MSNYLETDFCDPDEGLDYIFGYMSAVYGSSFTRHWENVDPQLVRSVWRKELGKFLAYKPSLNYAIEQLPVNMPPSAIAFKKACNAGPEIPVKSVMRIERQQTQYEKARTEMLKAEALAKLAELKRDIKANIAKGDVYE